MPGERTFHAGQKILVEATVAGPRVYGDGTIGAEVMSEGESVKIYVAVRDVIMPADDPSTDPVGTVRRLTRGDLTGELIIKTAARPFDWKFLTRLMGDGDENLLDGYSSGSGLSALTEVVGMSPGFEVTDG